MTEYARILATGLYGESGPFWVLRGEANRFGSGPKLRMPAFEVIT